MSKIHFVHNYLLAPTHPVTINLVGCGGTGSHVLTCLARMNTTLKALGYPGLHVCAYDNDTVTEPNIGRQLFSLSDIGRNKAELLITRVNRFFGTAWEAIPELYYADRANIIVSCVDNLQTRLKIAENIGVPEVEHEEFMQMLYWMDFGNTQKTGQVVLGSFVEIPQPKSGKYETVGKLPCFTELFDTSEINEEENGPSCSMAEAIGKQDLFINSTLAELGCDILWKMLREYMIDYSGLYLNLKSMNVNPIPL